MASDDKDRNSGKPSTGFIIAIVAQSVAILFLIGFLVWFAFIRKNKDSLGGGGIDASTRTVPIKVGK